MSQDNKAVTNSCLHWQLSDLFIDNDRAEPLHEKHRLRQGHPLLLDRMDNYDNMPHTYTDRMLSITSPLKGWLTDGWEILWGTRSLPFTILQEDRAPGRYWTGSLRGREKKWGRSAGWIQWKIAPIMKIYCVKHIMMKRLTTLQTQTHLGVVLALWGQLYVHLKEHRVQATTPERLMYFWSQMQCPAVNLMISLSKTPSERWE